jgi:predicted PurR-regulated permease PerM
VIALAGPATTWIERTALSVQKLEQVFRATTKPLEDIKKATGELQQATKVATPTVQEIRVAVPALGDLLLSGTLHVFASILSTMILVYFLLVAGDVFLRKLVLVIPTFRDKKRRRHNAADRDGHIVLSAQFHLGKCRLGRSYGDRDRLLGLPKSTPVGCLDRDC